MILILCSPRTGSSLVTKIFAEHGVWLGEVPTKNNGFGYKHYENQFLKNKLKEIAQKQYKDIPRVLGEPMKTTKEGRTIIANAVRALNPPDLWAFKVMVEYGPLFFQFDPTLIFIRREEKHAINSIVSKGPGRTKAEARRVHRKRMSVMAEYEKEYGGAWVDTDELIEGDYQTIKAAIEYSGLVFNPAIVDRAVDKEKWHHSR